ncbi:MAG TPA: hypothetical protein DCS39_04720 [Rhodobiaceae bacterium]|nr:hypothetical protein [Rhodobiaceae bacterium]|tara:strand:- start:629 stop:1426 length:798 start_codon:yes stop_codon:yes gene_type:complete
MQLPSNFLASLALHAGLVFLIGFWTPMLNEARMSDQSLPIEIITIDQFTRLVEETTMPDKVDTRQEPTAHKQSTATPNLQADAMPMSDAVQKPNEAAQTTSETATDAPRFRVDTPFPFARPIRPPRPLLDIGRVRALLNKTPDKKTADSGVMQNERALSASGRLTLNEVDAFRAQMRRCWSPPAGAKQAENLVVRVRLSLTPAGAISAGPVVVNRSLLGDPFFRAAAESVLRAIRRCQPFSMPAEKYAGWRNIELTFDPRRMLGG